MTDEIKSLQAGDKFRITELFLANTNSEALNDIKVGHVIKITFVSSTGLIYTDYSLARLGRDSRTVRNIWRYCVKLNNPPNNVLP